MSNYIQIWHCQWAKPEDLTKWNDGKTPYMTGEQLANNLDKAFENGGLDAKFKHERNGIVKLAEALKERMDSWRDVEAVEGRVEAMPIWDLDKFLAEWNVT